MGKKSLLVIATLLIAMVCSISMVFAAEYTFSYGNQQPENSPRTKSMLWFEEEMEKRTDGRIQVEIHHSGVLGNEQEMFEMTVSGEIQGTRGGFWTQLNKEYFLIYVPFLFNNYEEWLHFNKSEMVENMNTKGSINGIYIPSSGIFGFRNILTTYGVIKEPGDMKGKKHRVPGQEPVIWWYEGMGANPQNMAFSDVYMAMKTGVIDGVCNDPSTLYTNKTHEAAPYFSNLDYLAGGPDPLMVNMAWYEALPDDLKTIFDEVSDEAMDYSNELFMSLNVEFTQKLIEESKEAFVLSEHPELIPAWQEASAPVAGRLIEAGFFTQEQLDEARKIVEEFRNK
ncbi:MAG: TRAP transporter substrate-binding protein [bacterium]|nr:TRAP transporter substrate-binding protein [bacterium]